MKALHESVRLFFALKKMELGVLMGVLSFLQLSFCLSLIYCPTNKGQSGKGHYISISFVMFIFK